MKHLHVIRVPQGHLQGFGVFFSGYMRFEREPEFYSLEYSFTFVIHGFPICRKSRSKYLVTYWANLNDIFFFNPHRRMVRERTGEGETPQCERERSVGCLPYVAPTGD